MKIKKKIQPKIVIFTAVKNHCILHGRVFVMRFSSNFMFSYNIQCWGDLITTYAYNRMQVADD